MTAARRGVLVALAVVSLPLAGDAGEGSLAAPPPPLTQPRDTLVQLWGSSVTASPGGRATVSFRLDPGSAGEGVGRVRGRLTFVPSFLEHEELLPGDAGGRLEVDATPASTGVVAFDLASEDAAGRLDRGTLLRITFRVSAAPGVSASVLLELDAVESPTGTDLLGRTTVREGTVLVR